MYRTERRDRFELVIVDNGSTDETPTLAREVDRFLINETPRNLARSLNVGVRAASSELLFILNNDIVVLSSDWVSRFQAAVHGRGAEIVVPTTVEGTTMTPALYDVVRDVSDRGATSDVRLEEITHLEMACTVMTRSALERCGPFDESLPLWYFDLELLIAVRAAGIRPQRCRDVAARHFGNATIRYAKGAPVVEALRIEHERFCARHSEDELTRLGLAFPHELGPTDLQTGMTTITTETLDAWRRVWRDRSRSEDS